MDFLSLFLHRFLPLLLLLAPLPSSLPPPFRPVSCSPFLPICKKNVVIKSPPLLSLFLSPSPPPSLLPRCLASRSQWTYDQLDYSVDFPEQYNQLGISLTLHAKQNDTLTEQNNSHHEETSLHVIGVVQTVTKSSSSRKMRIWSWNFFKAKIHFQWHGNETSSKKYVWSKNALKGNGCTRLPVIV